MTPSQHGLPYPDPPERGERDERSIGERVRLPRQSLGLLLGLTLGVAAGALCSALVTGAAVALLWLLALLVARWL